MFVRSGFPFNYDVAAASDETAIDCSFDPVTGEVTPSLAKQSFAEECDINTIVRRFGLTGELPHDVRMPTFQDFVDVPTYHEAMNAIAEANAAFYEMPADVRARFGNDPGSFVEFCSDAANRDEAVKLGLVLPREADGSPVDAPVAAPDPVPDVPVPAKPAAAPKPR